VSPSSDRCAECGAAQAGGACIECFHALLAFENENPPAFGAVHHLTVACYYLQHPAGYALPALEMWRTMVADSLAGRATVEEMLRRARKRFEGAARARVPGATAPRGWPSRWPMTVTAVLRPDERLTSPEYIDRAMAWARSTHATLSETRLELPLR
jgi:hypothetical protein